MDLTLRHLEILTLVELLDSAISRQKEILLYIKVCLERTRDL